VLYLQRSQLGYVLKGGTRFPLFLLSERTQTTFFGKLTSSRLEQLTAWITRSIVEHNQEQGYSNETEVFLVELLFRNVNGTDYLEIYVDTDRGITIDICARLSRKLAEEVEIQPELQDLLPNRFRLDVSSPGLSRPLKLERQYRKNVGRLLRVKYKDSSEVYHVVRGWLVHFSEDAPIELSLQRVPSKKEKNTEAELLKIPLAQLVEATVEVEF
jgi:ribosome maturation factor RimP